MDKALGAYFRLLRYVLHSVLGPAETISGFLTVNLILSESAIPLCLQIFNYFITASVMKEIRGRGDGGESI